MAIVTIPPQLYVSFDGSEPEPERMQWVGSAYGRLMLKPSGGLWTSPLKDGIGSPFVDQIYVHGREDYWLGPQCRRFVFEPEPDLNVLVFDTRSDFLNILPRSSWPTFSERHWERNLHVRPHVARMMAKQPSPIDWRQYDGRYDAIWARGYLPPGWDCECVFWTRWAFEDVYEVTPEERAL